MASAEATGQAGEAGSQDEQQPGEGDVQARLVLLAARYPGLYEGDGQAIARRAIEGAVARDHRLRRIPLTNVDEPVNVFVPSGGAEPGDRA